MKYDIFFLTFCFCCVSTNVKAQLSTNEQPISYSLKSSMVEEVKNLTPSIILPKLDMAKIEAEDREDEEYDMPPRFGYQHFVNYDLKNSGIWYKLPNGDKVWQFNVICPDALSVNFCYDKFWIPEGGKFFVYSKDRKYSIGAFTNKNNKSSKEENRGFATGLIYSNDVILEYYQPKTATSDAIISIDYVVHGYRHIRIGEKFYGDGGSCMVNVNCEEGQNWQNEKRAVALILVNGNRYCTGSLINTTDFSQKPYLLTANHCLGEWANNDIQHDATYLPDLDYYSFWWNYEESGCTNTVEPNHFTTSGATILANNSVSDFALLRLWEDPKDIVGYTPYYLGWDRTGQSGNPGVCIHHPKGDVKKVSTVYSCPVSTNYIGYSEIPSANHWKVIWDSTLNGHSTTQGGSSGSPLLTSTHKVIGQLHGGYADCGDSINAPDWYGKFDVSWGGDGNYNNYRRLNCWLDSANTSVTSLEGLLVVSSSFTMDTDTQVYGNILITNTGTLTIQSDIELMGNSSVIVESGGCLIVDGGTLTNVDVILKEGASLQITHNGTIEIRETFDAQIGAMVDIVYGKIIQN